MPLLMLLLPRCRTDEWMHGNTMQTHTMSNSSICPGESVKSMQILPDCLGGCLSFCLFAGEL